MIELPYPAQILWPNGRGGWQAKHRATKKHREWARLATLAVLPPCFTIKPDVRIQLLITVYPKTRNTPDADNALAACKSLIDGIADALKVNDSRFNLPRLQFGEPVKNGRVSIAILGL